MLSRTRLCLELPLFAYVDPKVAGRLKKKFEEKALMGQKWLKDAAGPSPRSCRGCSF